MTKEIKHQICGDGFIQYHPERQNKEALAQPERDYERGFIDGMQKQMQSSVDKSVNSMSQRTWVGLTRDEQSFVYSSLHESTLRKDSFWVDFANAIEAKLKEKNNDPSF